MQISVTFKNLDSSEALKSYVQKKLDRFDRLLDSPAEANVVLSVEKIRHIAEITLVSDRLKINAKESTGSMHSSIDLLIDNLKKQITKTKQKNRSKRIGSKDSIKGKIEDVDSDYYDGGIAGSAMSDEISNEIIEEKIDYKPIDVEDAIFQMDVERNNFFVFTNSKSNKVNVLYRRKDGNLGLIQPIN